MSVPQRLTDSRAKGVRLRLRVVSCGAPLRRARANATAQGRSQSAAPLTRAGARTRTPATETRGTSRAPTCPVSGALARLNLRGTGAFRAQGKRGVVTRGFGGASRRDPSRAARVVARKAALRAARSSRSGFVRPRRSRRASSRGRGPRVGRVASPRVAVVGKLPVWNGYTFSTRGRPSVFPRGRRGPARSARARARAPRRPRRARRRRAPRPIARSRRRERRVLTTRARGAFP